MVAGIAGCGSLGIALETVPGTYVAPTKFFPILEESLQRMQETVWRRAIRKSADFTGATPGNVQVEGDISMEALEDVIPYFLLCSRTSVVKSAGPNFSYEFTGVCNAIPPKTMSITVVRNGIVFGYVGMVVSSFTFTVEEGLLQFNVSMLGRDEGDQATPVEVFSTTEPFGAGQYSIELPVGSVVLDTDTFEFTVDDSAEAQYRLKTPGQGAAFVAFGERTATATVERDFESKAEYNAFKALTKRALRFTATKTVNNSVVCDMPASITDTYEVGLSGQGDLVRASVAYQGAVDGSGNAYKVTVKTQEDVAVV